MSVNNIIQISLKICTEESVQHQLIYLLEFEFGFHNLPNMTIQTQNKSVNMLSGLSCPTVPNLYDSCDLQMSLSSAQQFDA